MNKTPAPNNVYTRLGVTIVNSRFVDRFKIVTV